MRQTDRHTHTFTTSLVCSLSPPVSSTETQNVSVLNVKSTWQCPGPDGSSVSTTSGWREPLAPRWPPPWSSGCGTPRKPLVWSPPMAGSAPAVILDLRPLQTSTGDRAIESQTLRETSLGREENSGKAGHDSPRGADTCL